ncbi:hypothetical protein QTP86_015763, partial [Hemibagrus guttatus]
DSIQRKRLAKKKWDMDRTEENRQEYKELQRRVKREVSKAKQKAYEELYTRTDIRYGLNNRDTSNVTQVNELLLKINLMYNQNNKDFYRKGQDSKHQKGRPSSNFPAKLNPVTWFAWNNQNTPGNV